MGRPLKPVDGEQVRKLARLGCTQDEIGAFFGVSGDTIARRFEDELGLGAASLKISLRRCQWKSAKLGSVPMQIHLGKQYLGQSDKTDVTSGGKSVPIVMVEAVNPDDRDPDPGTAAEEG